MKTIKCIVVVLCVMLCFITGSCIANSTIGSASKASQEFPSSDTASIIINVGTGWKLIVSNSVDNLNVVMSADSNIGNFSNFVTLSRSWLDSKIMMNFPSQNNSLDDSEKTIEVQLPYNFKGDLILTNKGSIDLVLNKLNDATIESVGNGKLTIKRSNNIVASQTSGNLSLTLLDSKSCIFSGVIDDRIGANNSLSIVKTSKLIFEVQSNQVSKSRINKYELSLTSIPDLCMIKTKGVDLSLYLTDVPHLYKMDASIINSKVLNNLGLLNSSLPLVEETKSNESSAKIIHLETQDALVEMIRGNSR